VAETDGSVNTGMNKKILGMPMWLAVSGGAAILAGVYFWYRKKQSAASSSSNSVTSTNGASTDSSGYQGLDTEEYESLLAQLRDLQEQEGSEPNPVPGPPGPPGPPGESGGPPLQGGNPPGGGGPVPVKAPPPNPPSQKRTVKVAPFPAWNSTLWGIAGKEYGKSDTANVDKIFNANKSLIEGQEIRHGMTRTQADSKKWLYPGEVLTIP
jgi:hypothetical protein